MGRSLYRQVKGVSMGCYFSKEMSDLVLLYSEYKYLLVQDSSKVTFLKRYADDGIILFSVTDSTSLLSELNKLMLFYPSLIQWFYCRRSLHLCARYPFGLLVKTDRDVSGRGIMVVKLLLCFVFCLTYS